MDINTPLVGTSSIHPQQINQYIWDSNQRVDGRIISPPVGSLYVTWGRVNGILTEIAAAQFIWETGWGKNTARRNPAGIRAGPSSFRTYPNWNDGISAHLSLLRKYATPGTEFWQYQINAVGYAGTIRSMSNVWCPPSDNPDGVAGDDYAKQICKYIDGFRSTPSPVPELATHWAKDHMNSAIAAGVIQGYVDGNTRPDWSVTRAELATILYRVFNHPAYEPVVPPPDDINWSHWAFQYVMKVLAWGWMFTYENRFRPDAYATRDEVALALIRAGAPRPLQREILGFPDGTASMREAFGAGWVSGYPDGTLKPYNPVTRGELTAILDNCMGWSTETAGIIPMTAGLTGYYEDWRYPLLEAAWVEQDRIWVPAGASTWLYSQDTLAATGYHLEPEYKLSDVPWYANTGLWVGAGIVGLGAYLALRKK